MHALSYITEKYKQLEGLLVNKYGAQGTSLGMYAKSLKGRLPEQILQKISEVKELRNSLQHFDQEADATSQDSDSKARKEFFNIQRKVDYILKACSYPEEVLAQIDVAFKKLENERNEITALMGAPLGIQGATLEEKIDKVENELSIEALWKLCQFRDYFERAVNDDFADALRSSQQTKCLYDEIIKDLRGKNAPPTKNLSQESYTIDKINDDVKLIDGIHQKLLLLQGMYVKAPTFNMQTVLARVNKIVDTTFTQTLLSENQNCVSPLIPTTEPLSPKQKIEDLRVALVNALGARLHLKGKNLQEKIENGKSAISPSLRQRLVQFDKSSELAIQDGEIDEQKLEELQKLYDDILSSIADNSTKSPSQPTSPTSLKKESSTDLGTVKEMQQKMFQFLGSQLHCGGKTLRSKIDILGQRKDVSKSVIQKLYQFETETDEVLTHNLIKPDAVAQLQKLALEIQSLLKPVIDDIQAKNTSSLKK